MVSSNGFSVRVPEARAVPREPDMASLPHGAEYSVLLRNDRPARCDATLSVDGVPMGTFRLAPYGSARLERPAGQARKFTFLREGSAAARAAGVPSGAQANGLITVEFLPERVRVAARGIVPESAAAVPQSLRADGEECSLNSVSSCASYSSGGTALGRSSDQHFASASALRDVDAANRTVLHLRLVVSEALTSVRAYEPGALAAGEPQPFYGNAEPPRLPRWSSFAH